MFGMWGSSAILLYIREAPLGLKGGDLALKTEGRGSLNVRDLKARAGNRSGMVAQVLEDLAPVVLPAPARIEKMTEMDDLLKQFDQRIGDVEALLDAEREAGTPRYVESSDSKKHVVAHGDYTHCGWNWRAAKRSARIIRSGPADLSVGWCIRCQKGAMRNA